MDRGAWRATVHRAAKSDMTEVTARTHAGWLVAAFGIFSVATRAACELLHFCMQDLIPRPGIEPGLLH